MALTPQQKFAAVLVVRQIAATAIDLTVRERAAEVLKILSPGDHAVLLTAALATARDGLLTANRVRALDVLERLIRA